MPVARTDCDAIYSNTSLCIHRRPIHRTTTTLTDATRKPAAARADNTPPRFTMRKATRTKYDPVVYDRHAFETRGGVLRELDERERWLGERYVDIMREPAVVFLQSNGRLCGV